MITMTMEGMMTIITTMIVIIPEKLTTMMTIMRTMTMVVMMTMTMAVIMTTIVPLNQVPFPLLTYTLGYYIELIQRLPRINLIVLVKI